MIANGAWGFAATDRLTREGVQACAAEAVAIAKASALAKREKMWSSPPEEVFHVDTWQNPLPQRTPFAFRSSGRSTFCWRQAGQEMRRVKRRHGRRRLDVVSAQRTAVCLESRFFYSSNKNAIGRGNRGHRFLGQRNSEKVVSEQFWRAAPAGWV